MWNSSGKASSAATDGDRLIGFLNAEPRKTVLHVCELAVRHHRQSQGIGRLLVEHA
ncbi:MAG: GNAT family N-acetyltransferase [Luteimonas sp.]|nr:GNAT family N-acetyltransferase [Luteimonas sp.]